MLALVKKHKTTKKKLTDSRHHKLLNITQGLQEGEKIFFTKLPVDDGLVEATIIDINGEKTFRSWNLDTVA